MMHAIKAIERQIGRDVKASRNFDKD